MKKIILSLILTCLAVFAKAQVADFKWAKGFGSAGDDHSHSITTDGMGNTYTTGYFHNTIDFDPDSAKTYNVSSGGNDDIFILKMNAFGAMVWVKRIGSSGGEAGHSICLDKWGNIIVTGRFVSTVDFDPDPTKVFNLGSSGNEDAFVLKLDNDGNFKWAVKFGSNSGDNALSVSTDKDGNIYSVGQFVNTIDMDPGSNISNLVTKGNSDIYISKLDSAGKFVWARQIGGIGFESCRSISVDGSSNLYIGGYYQKQVDFDPGTGTYLVGNPTQGGGSFLLKLDAAGQFGWVKNMGNLMEWGYSDRSVLTDANGSIYGTGWFLDTADFNFDTTVVNNMIAKGQHDVFIFKLNANGSYSWAKSMGGNASSTTTAEAISMTVDAVGNIYSIGRFAEKVDFDPGPNTFFLTSVAITDTYIAKLNAAGTFVWAIQMRGLGEGNAVTVDPFKNVYATSIYSGTVDFDPHLTKTYNLVSKGNWDMVIQKIIQCKSSASSITFAACGQYRLNGKTYTSSGKYLQIIPNDVGCDSVITINLTVTTIDTVVFMNGKQLFTRITGPGYTYQWIDCKNGQHLLGKTFSTFNPILNGQYAVIIKYNNCSDTSSCYNISTIGIDERTAPAQFAVYPNPVNANEIRLEIFREGNASLKLYNVQGQMVYENHELVSGSNMLDISTLPSGIYSLDLSLDGTVSRTKLVIVK